GAIVVEIDLRVADKTLSADDVPKALAATALATRKQELADDHARFEQKSKDRQQQFVEARKRQDDAKKGFLDSEGELDQATRRHAQEQKLDEVRKRYASRSAADLLAELNESLEEEAGLAGAFGLASRGFDKKQEQAGRRKQEFDALKPPEDRAATRGEA